MHTLAAAFLVTFAALFPIVNPLEGAPSSTCLTRGIAAGASTRAARQVAFNGLALLLGSMVLGPWLLVFFASNCRWSALQAGWSSRRWLEAPEPGTSGPTIRRTSTAGRGWARAGAFYPLTMR